ncbi:MAG: hypothetical protein VX603_10035 [Gemmatimonadota bacterium]|nr:hypothetical protein [Gemmatimonadota bacterium]
MDTSIPAVSRLSCNSLTTIILIEGRQHPFVPFLRIDDGCTLHGGGRLPGRAVPTLQYVANMVEKGIFDRWRL